MLQQIRNIYQLLAKSERKRKKISGFISLAILITIIIFVPDKVISNMLLYGVFMQTLTITRIAYKITNNKYGHEEYEKETANSCINLVIDIAGNVLLYIYF